MSDDLGPRDGSEPFQFGANGAEPKKSLCINGTRFDTTQDDEFVKDRYLNATSRSIDKVPTAFWGTRIWYQKDGRPGYQGARQDEIDTDPSFTPYYNPFRKARDGSLEIAAVPIPAAHQNDAILNPTPVSPKHPSQYKYLSGYLNGHPLTYGYIEVSSRAVHEKGMWSAPLWLIAHHGSDGAGHGYTEMDANEIFGNMNKDYSVYQTLHRNWGGPDLHTSHIVSSSDSQYHTYGIYWTTTTIAFLIDHQVTGGPYSNQDIRKIGAIQATGPESPIINMEVFSSKGFASAPDDGTIGKLNEQYFRWYQDTEIPCSNSAITIAAPTPSPTL